MILLFNFNGQIFIPSMILIPLIFSMAGSFAGSMLRGRIGAE
jgi:hypothetical protein